MAKIQRGKVKPPSKTALFKAAKRWDAAAVKAMLKAAPALAHSNQSARVRCRR